MGWGQMGYSDHSHAPYTYGYWGEGATSSQHGVPCNLCGEMTVGAIPVSAWDNSSEIYSPYAIDML